MNGGKGTFVEPIFLTIDDVIFIHRRELEQAGGERGVRDMRLVESATMAPQATFEGQWLHHGVFEMAGAYVVGFVQNHPFVDGNKRTGAAAALTFLYLNGYEVEEQHPEEFADIVLRFVTHEIGREQIVEYFRARSHTR